MGKCGQFQSHQIKVYAGLTLGFMYKETQRVVLAGSVIFVKKVSQRKKTLIKTQRNSWLNVASFSLIRKRWMQGSHIKTGPNFQPDIWQHDFKPRTVKLLFPRPIRMLVHV